MGILMIRCPKSARAISTGTYVKAAPSAPARYFSVKPTVRIAMQRMSGSLKTHGFVILKRKKPSMSASISAPRDARLSFRSEID